MTTTMSGTTVTFNDATVQPAPARHGSCIVTIYTAPATFDVTTKKAAGLKSIRVEIQGAGGGGSGSMTLANHAGGRGGWGAVGHAQIPGPAMPAPIAVTVGTGGTAGAAGPVGPTTGGTGGPSSFGTFITAPGAIGGVNGAAPTYTATPGLYATGNYAGPYVSAAPGVNSVAVTQIANGAYWEGYGEVGATSGVPLFYDVYGTIINGAPSPNQGWPTNITNVPAPVAGTTVPTAYAVGGGGGRSGSATTTGVVGGAGRPGIVIIEEYY